MSGMMHKYNTSINQSWKWVLPSNDLKQSIRWELAGKVWNSSHNRWDAGCCSGHTFQALQPLCCSPTALGVTEEIPEGPHVYGTGSSHIHQTYNTFLQLFLASVLCNTFNSAVLLPSSVSSRILLSLLELHFPLPISSSVAFADNQSWPQEFLPLLYLPPQRSLLKLPPMQIFFLIPAH